MSRGTERGGGGGGGGFRRDWKERDVTRERTKGRSGVAERDGRGFRRLEACCSPAVAAAAAALLLLLLSLLLLLLLLVLVVLVVSREGREGVKMAARVGERERKAARRL